MLSMSRQEGEGGETETGDDDETSLRQHPVFRLQKEDSPPDSDRPSRSPDRLSRPETGVLASTSKILQEFQESLDTVQQRNVSNSEVFEQMRQKMSELARQNEKLRSLALAVPSAAPTSSSSAPSVEAV